MAIVMVALIAIVGSVTLAVWMWVTGRRIACLMALGGIAAFFLLNALRQGAYGLYIAGAVAGPAGAGALLLQRRRTLAAIFGLIPLAYLVKVTLAESGASMEMRDLYNAVGLISDFAAIGCSLLISLAAVFWTGALLEARLSKGGP